uniref:Uncharacterized protein n=1 Tax=Arundo donax TaxID=35708 RepID=A0A0A9EGZ5_ARUDO
MISPMRRTEAASLGPRTKEQSCPTSPATPPPPPSGWSSAQSAATAMPQVLPRDLTPGHSAPPRYGPTVTRTARRRAVDTRRGQKNAAIERRWRAKKRR